jgi:peptide deformylase
MMETMDDAGGTGLAAPQVHVPLRIFVFKISPERSSGAPDDEAVGHTVLINPVIEPLGGEQELGWEGCLSIPGMRAAVPRYRRVRYSGVDCDRRTISREASGFHARVVQHENDHLDGILYPMRMQDFRLFGFNEELARAAQEGAQAMLATETAR